jgi:hypothetical protein
MDLQEHLATGGTDDASAERFTDGVANVMMATEELRRTIVTNAGDLTVHHLIDWRHELEGVVGWLDAMARWTDDNAGAQVEASDLYRHCSTRAATVAQQLLKSSLLFHEPVLLDDVSLAGNIDDLPPDVVRRDAQAAIARIVELNLVLHHNHLSTEQQSDLQSSREIIESYVSFQRQVLRLRARPSIAELVQARQDGRIVIPSIEDGGIPHLNKHLINNVLLDDDGEEDISNAQQVPEMQQFHAPVFTVVLGEAAALIHPLLQWQINLPLDIESPIVTDIRRLCVDAVGTIDEQAQELVKKVSDWFWEDRPIDDWMRRSVNDGSGDDNPYEQHHERGRRELAILDALVEEMAFCCQVQARYQSLIQGLSQQKGQETIGNELLPEWTWKYATLECYLAMQQWRSALELATPVHIVMGTAVQVPSVVEDALYLSTRALERAASTRLFQAIGTVAHAVSRDVWSIEMNSGVHQALLDERGCWNEPAKETEEVDAINKKEGAKSAFASALLDAFDEDLGPNANLKSRGAPLEKSPMSSSRPPSSGGFLSSIVGGGEKIRRMQLDTQFCVLNGIHATTGACRSLVAFLDSLLSDNDNISIPATDEGKASSMIQLAREELFRYEGSYRKMLAESIEVAFVTWCGRGDVAAKGSMPFSSLRFFLVEEQYNLNASEFYQMEADERLERDMVGPLKDSIFFQQLGEKCDEAVLRLAGEFIATTVVKMVVECLWECDRKFTDWGSLLLSKQVRLLQAFTVRADVSAVGAEEGPTTRTALNLVHSWEYLSQVVAVLQLEKPSDWLAYQSTSILSPDELSRTLSLRIDFPTEAIQSIVASVRQRAESS